jgi:2'-5' RNA ligase
MVTIELMGSDSKGLLSRVEERLNVYALVIYIPDPLGRFLDDLRRELVPGCNPHAHVSVLPPRPLPGDWQAAGEQVQAFTAGQRPFPVELGEIQMFPGTNVIYVELRSGREELSSMHDALNGKALVFEEPFVYHPHVTLAQEIPPGEVAAVHELAGRRWKEFQGERVFQADHAAFVQSTAGNCWIDLANFALGAV